MSEFFTVIGSVVVGGLISLGTMCLNELFQRKRRLEEKEERFFYAAYDRRIASHERLAKIVGEHRNHFLPIGPVKLYTRHVNEFLKTFSAELVASRIFADKKVLEAAEILKEAVGAVFKESLKSHQLNTPDGFLDDSDGALGYGQIIASAYNKFVETIREVPGIEAIEGYNQRTSRPNKELKKDKNPRPRGYTDKSGNKVQ